MSIKEPVFEALNTWSEYGVCMWSTHTMEEIDENLGIVSTKAPCDSDRGWVGQEGLNFEETPIRSDVHRVEVGPKLCS